MFSPGIKSVSGGMGILIETVSASLLFMMIMIRISSAIAEDDSVGLANIKVFCGSDVFPLTGFTFLVQSMS